MTVLDENGKVVIGGNGKTLLAPFGSRKEIAELADRIERMLKVYDPTLEGKGDNRKLSKTEALRMASVALAHGLDPSIGEIYPVVSKKGVFSVGVGRDGWSKALAFRLNAEGGGNAWPEFHMIIDEGERQRLQVPAGAICYECRLRDTRTVEATVKLIEAMSKAGASWQEIKELAGPGYVIGIGWYKPSGGYEDLQYPPIQRAMKRAYCDAVKKRAHLPFEIEEGTDVLPDDYTGPMLSERAAAKDTIVDGNLKKSQGATPTAPAPDEYRPDPADIDAVLKRKQAADRERNSETLFGKDW
jgi:hypothetical protein